MDANAPSQATNSGLLFFSVVDLQLSKLSDLSNEAHTPTKEIVAHLLGRQGDTLAWRELVAATLSPKARLLRAQFLLHDADKQDAISQRSQEDWTLLETDWRWIAATRKQELIQYAHAQGLKWPEVDIEAVLRAVDDELLPLMHLKRYFLTLDQSLPDSVRSPHIRFLNQHRLSTTAPGVVAELYCSYAFSFIDKASDFTESLQQFAQLAADHALPEQQMYQVGRRAAEGLSERIGSWLSAQPGLPEIDAQLSRLKTLEEALPAQIGLMALLSVLHSARSQKLMEAQNVKDAMREIALSLSHDPFNRLAREQVSALEHDVQRLEHNLDESPPGSKAAARRVLRQAREGLNALSAFGHSEEGVRISERWHRALQNELPARLGLDLLNRETPNLVESFLACVEAAGRESGSDSELFAAQTRCLAIAQDARFADLDWVRITEGLRSAPPDCGGLIGIYLKLPQPLAESPLAKRLRAPAPSETHSAPMARSRGAERLRVVARLFSSQDLLPKGLAAAGLVLLIHGGLIALARSVRDGNEDRAYAAAVDAAAKADDDLLIVRAFDFLEVDGVRPDHPRHKHVVELLREGALRKVMKLAESGAELEAKELLKRVKVAAAGTRAGN